MGVARLGLGGVTLSRGHVVCEPLPEFRHRARAFVVPLVTIELVVRPRPVYVTHQFHVIGNKIGNKFARPPFFAHVYLTALAVAAASLSTCVLRRACGKVRWRRLCERLSSFVSGVFSDRQWIPVLFSGENILPGYAKQDGITFVISGKRDRQPLSLLNLLVHLYIITWYSSKYIKPVYKSLADGAEFRKGKDEKRSAEAEGLADRSKIAYCACQMSIGLFLLYRVRTKLWPF